MRHILKLHFQTYHTNIVILKTFVNGESERECFHLPGILLALRRISFDISTIRRQYTHKGKETHNNSGIEIAWY
jgi:hypothetical protein